MNKLLNYEKVNEISDGILKDYNSKFNTPDVRKEILDKFIDAFNEYEVTTILCDESNNAADIIESNSFILDIFGTDEDGRPAQYSVGIGPTYINFSDYGIEI